MPVRGSHARKRLPPRERLRQAVCGPVYRWQSRVQVAHGLSAKARPRGGMGPGREDSKPLLECASRIAPYIRYRGAKESRCTTVVKQAAPMLAYTLAQLLQDRRVRVHLEASVSERIAITT